MLNKGLVILFCIIVFSGCSHQMNPKRSKKNHNNFFSDPIYFKGYGIGSNENKENAYKIAQLNALGNLSKNIEIEVLSIIEYYATEKNTKEIDESINKKIGIISSTKIRDPIYIVSEENYDGAKYNYEIIAKKKRNEYVTETASDLNFNVAGDILLEMFKNKFNE